MNDPASRDRDASGRPRSARPRDAAGRPLPRDAVGRAVPRPPESALPPAEALEEAQRFLDEDRPFAAHEVLEAAWKAAPEDERELWRGLAQLAVGLTHLQRGNARGAIALLRRAAERIAPYGGAGPTAGSADSSAGAGPTAGSAGSTGGAGPHGVDVDALAGAARRLADGIEGGGVSAGAERARVRLRRSGGGDEGEVQDRDGADGHGG